MNLLRKHGVSIIGALGLLIGLHLCSLYSYLLFHGLVEMYIVSVALGIFILAWNTRHILDNGYLLFLGISYLFIGSVEILHTLAYKGMGVFITYDADLPTQLWIISGYMEGSVFLCASLMIKRQLNALRWFIILFFMTAIFLILIFSRIFPDCYIEGQGLTLFKKVSECVISVMLLIAGGLLYRKRSLFDPFVLKMILIGIGCNIGARASFIFYVSVYGLSNKIGHYFQMASFFCIYRAIISTGLTRPHTLLYRENEQQKLALKKSQEELERRIEERTRDLSNSNAQLKKEMKDRIKTEKLLAHRNMELKRINQELEDFAHIVSHDLREPLRGIYNFSNILQNSYGGQFKDDGLYMLNYLSVLSKRMEDQIISILHYSRVGRESIKFTRTDPNKIVAEVIDSLIHMIQDHHTEIRIPRPLPHVLCDPERIAEVFRNLISNAVKYGNKTDPWVEIGYLTNGEVKKQMTDDGTSLENCPPAALCPMPNISCKDSKFRIFYVRDNGIGIESKHFEKIFQIFQRVHSQKTYPGTGVGLTISKKIIERLCGKLWVESAVGLGSTFYFTLLKCIDESSDSDH